MKLFYDQDLKSKLFFYFDITQSADKKGTISIRVKRYNKKNCAKMIEVIH